MTTTELRDRVVALAKELPAAVLPEAMALLRELLAQSQQPTGDRPDPSEEATLLATIQRRLSPEEQARFDTLRDQNEWGEMTEAEHQELISFVERIETEDVERTAALIRLAQLRNVRLEVLLGKYSRV